MTDKIEEAFRSLGNLIYAAGDGQHEASLQTIQDEMKRLREERTVLSDALEVSGGELGWTQSQLTETRDQLERERLKYQVAHADSHNQASAIRRLTDQLEKAKAHEQRLIDFYGLQPDVDGVYEKQFPSGMTESDR